MNNINDSLRLDYSIEILDKIKKASFKHRINLKADLFLIFFNI